MAEFDEGAPHIGAQAELRTREPFANNLIFHGGGREVMRITPEGELIVHDATEAATALKQAWDHMMGSR